MTNADEAISNFMSNIELKSNEIGSPNEDGKATERVVFSFSGDINIENLSATTNLNVKNAKAWNKTSIPTVSISWKTPSFNTSSFWGFFRDLSPIAVKTKSTKIIDSEISKETLLDYTFDVDLPSTLPIEFDFGFDLPSYNDHTTLSAHGISYEIPPTVDNLFVENVDVEKAYKITVDEAVKGFIEKQSLYVKDFIRSGGIQGEVMNLFTSGVDKLGQMVTDSISDKLKPYANGMNKAIENKLNDWLEIESNTSKIKSGLKAMTFTAWNFDDYPIWGGLDLTGFDLDDSLEGTDHVDTIEGKEGDDDINGADGDDYLTGGHGADKIRGGEGADTFIYNSMEDSKSGYNKRDLITDFNASEGDKIDLSSINEELTFIGSDNFGGDEGEIRFEDNILQINSDRDKETDFEVKLADVDTLTSDSLIL